jgi:hypothetical protein
MPDGNLRHALSGYRAPRLERKGERQSEAFAPLETGVRLLRIAETLEQNNRQPRRFTLELADEGEEPVDPLNPLQNFNPLFGNLNDLRTTKKTRGKAKAGTLSNRSKAFERRAY